MSRDLHYILINICRGSAATVVRQQGAPETTASRPSRSYTKRFTTCWYKEYNEVARYELDNGQALPESKLQSYSMKGSSTTTPIAPTRKTTTPYISMASMDVDHILQDSGAAAHVCPKDYASWCIYTTTLHSYRSYQSLWKCVKQISRTKGQL